MKPKMRFIYENETKTQSLTKKFKLQVKYFAAKTVILLKFLDKIDIYYENISERNNTENSLQLNLVVVLYPI